MKGLSANGSRAATRNSAIGGTVAMVADWKKRERTILLSFDWKSQDWTPTPPACQIGLVYKTPDSENNNAQKQIGRTLFEKA